MVLSRCPTIPITSPAGQHLIKSPKSITSKEYLLGRLDRIERFCNAPPLSGPIGKNGFYNSGGSNHGGGGVGGGSSSSSNYNNNNNLHPNRPKLMIRNSTMQTYHIILNHYTDRYRRNAFLQLNSNELRQCTPVRVNIRKLTAQNIIAYNERQRCSPAVMVATAASSLSFVARFSNNTPKNDSQTQSAPLPPTIPKLLYKRSVDA